MRSMSVLSQFASVMVLVCAVACIAIGVQSRVAQAEDAVKQDLTGRWVVTADYLGSTLYLRMDVEQKGDRITGKFFGDPFEGTVTGSGVQFLAKDTTGGTEDVKATMENGVMTGSALFTDGTKKERPLTVRFSAVKAPVRPAGAPQRHEFTPTIFYRQFSPFNKPVLTVAPGDTIHTTTVDAGGVDEKGVRRVLGGNPQTGPFYVESAMPGDVLVVHIVRLKLNRDWAGSDDAIVERGMNSDLAVKMKDAGKPVTWHLDVAKGMATSEKPGDHLKSYTVPLRPMLGCVAVAPAPAQAPPGTGDSGTWGGNMDFNEIVEGATVYLPVRNPGALLYFGDGHAAQGDGEINGNALETSMDVEVTVDVIPSKRLPGVRVESSTQVMAMGLAGSLDDAFREATANMSEWLETDYKLTPSEIAQVIGTASQYKVSEAADRNAGMVLKIDKERLVGVEK